MSNKILNFIKKADDLHDKYNNKNSYDYINKTPTEEELALLEQEVEKRAKEITKKQAPIEWFIDDYRRVYKKRR